MSDVSDRLRERACRTLDDVAMVRWRLGGVVAIAAVGLLIYLFTRSGAYVPTPEDVAAVATTVPVTSTTVVPDVVVNAAGAVHRPGLYTVSNAARVADVINAAGGPTDEADLDRINLAEKVSDGQRVYIVRKGQAQPETASSQTMPGAASGGAPAVVDVNTASLQQLDSLPGVGPATAQAIVDYRSQHGRFRTVDDLANVKGIGPAKLAQLKDLVRAQL